MSTGFVPNNRHVSLVSILAFAFFALSAANVRAQNVAQSNPLERQLIASESSKRASGSSSDVKKPATTEEKLGALEQMLEQQSQRLDQLQQTIAAQQETIQLLANKLNVVGRSPGTAGAAGPTDSAGPAATLASQPAPAPTVEDRLKKLEAIKFEGDLRLRAESFFGLTNSLSNGANPAVFGNELSPRNRMRLRARLKMSGGFGEESDWCKQFKCKEFEWGLRIASGSFADNISTNQTLTDFFDRKPFALDQAFVSYRPGRFRGHLQLQGGKFEPPWAYKFDAPWANSELMIDNDLMVEGFSESYTHTSKKSSLRELKFVAWQLPFLERNSAFVRNANGTVNIDQSRRGGRDLALYGGQVRARFESSARQKECVKAPCPAKVALNLSAANLYFSGTQFISPVQVFGSQLLLPVTFTIPASGTTPAQTITTQVSISRDLLVAGNGNLGLTNASNNATNRDGHLASGYNLVDMLARLDLKYSKAWPVSVLLNFVTNTQVHDVVTAGPGGADLLVPNNERHGFWGEIQVGKAEQKGDLAFGYAFMRIQKDAVLTPFNMSDITQQSDMRGHRFQFAYTADPRVTMAVIGIVTERPNGLFGPFTATPPGSLNRSTFRLQFDTVLKF